MSDKIDEIVDQLIKGGRGSGIRGHKSGPASDIKRKIDPSKKKKILASDRKAVRKEVRGHSDEKLQSAIDSHKELSESQHLSPGSRESYAAKHKALVSEQKKRNKNKDIESSEREEHGASLRTKFQELSDKWFGKGGPGSGRKGHKTSEGASAAMSDNRRANTEKYLDQLKTSLSLEKTLLPKLNLKKI